MKTKLSKKSVPALAQEITEKDERTVQTDVILDPNTIEITLVVRDFKDVLKTLSTEGRETTYFMELDGDHSLVTLESGQHPTKLVISGNHAVQLRIRIRAAKGGDSYLPLGIMFRRKNGINPRDKAQDVLGHRAFSFARMHLYGPSLYIIDTFADCGTDGEYKFSVIIQSQQNGTIGIIDPEIGNRPK